MDDGRPPESLADDPGFLAGLDDLEHGLSSEAPLHPRGADQPVRERPHRPLLDLFPPSAVGRRRPPAPFPGTALATRLPRTVVAGDIRAAPAASKPPSEAFYGLSETPFGWSSDPRFFYPAVSHDRALNAILEAIHAAEGLVVLTAPHGLGKTTVCRVAARDLDRRTMQSVVLDPPQSIEQLLQTVLVDFGVVSQRDLARAPQVQRDALTAALASFIGSLASLKASAVIVVDEAHAMPEAVLVAIADLVAALDSPRLLQIVLAGEPALTPMLARAGLRAPGGRDGVRVELRPLEGDEIAPYITHRLHAVDSRSRVDFSPAACARINALSKGVPRQVNLLCERVLIDGASSAVRVIDAGADDRAAKDLGLQMPADPPRALVRGVAIAVVFLALILAGGAGAAWIYRDAAIDAFSRWLNLPLAPAAPAPLLPATLDPVPVSDNALPPADNLRIRPPV